MVLSGLTSLVLILGLLTCSSVEERGPSRSPWRDGQRVDRDGLRRDPVPEPTLRIPAPLRRQCRGTRVLLMGAGDAGAQVLSDILRNPELGLRVVGLIDDDQRCLGRALHGVTVLGGRGAIPSLVRKLGVDQVLLAIPIGHERPDPRRRHPVRRGRGISAGAAVGRQIVGGRVTRPRPSRTADRRPARAPTGADGSRGGAQPHPRQAGADHRRRRVDRRGDRATGRATSSRRAWRSWTTTRPTCTICRLTLDGARRRVRPRRRARSRADARGVPLAPAAGGVPRRGPQARADPGGTPARGLLDERPRAPRTWSRPPPRRERSDSS